MELIIRLSLAAISSPHALGHDAGEGEKIRAMKLKKKKKRKKKSR